MINMHSKYDNMYKNEMFYALICINNHIIARVNCMLSIRSFVLGVSMFWISNLMYSIAFDGLIKKLEGFLTSKHNSRCIYGPNLQTAMLGARYTWVLFHHLRWRHRLHVGPHCLKWATCLMRASHDRQWWSRAPHHWIPAIVGVDNDFHKRHRH